LIILVLGSFISTNLLAFLYLHCANFLDRISKRKHSSVIRFYCYILRRTSYFFL